MDYTVVGDVVNVAKRLQDAAQSGQILFSQDTFEELKGVEAKRLKPLKLPGREERVTPYLIELAKK
jgi:class 3 adenylate cyclase